jgi:hypothetical protein
MLSTGADHALLNACCVVALCYVLLIGSQHLIVAAQQIEANNGSIIWSIPGAKMVFSSDASIEFPAAVNATTFATQSALDTALGGIQGQFGGIQGQLSGIQGQFGGIQGQLTTTSTRINGIDTVNNGLQAQVTQKFKPIYYPPI